MTQESQDVSSVQDRASNRMMKLRHLAIVTLDPDRLARFYADVFGMEELQRSKSGSVFMTDGTITLALLKNKAEGKPVGLNHIGFHIDDAEEVSRRIAEWGLDAPAKRPDDRPYAETRITDPDGNNIDLSLAGYQVSKTNTGRDPD